jgi:hypothetical protein
MTRAISSDVEADDSAMLATNQPSIEAEGMVFIAIPSASTFHYRKTILAKIFSLSDCFALSFPHVEVMGDDGRPRSRGHGVFQNQLREGEEQV